jgi:hypothetical protein
MARLQPFSFGPTLPFMPTTQRHTLQAIAPLIVGLRTSSLLLTRSLTTFLVSFLANGRNA